jgi:hypothetical protein
MPKSDAWKIDPTQNKWKLALDGGRYMRFEDAIKLETKIEIEELKDFVRNRAKLNPELADRDGQDPVDWSWDSAVDHIGWPDYNNLAVRTKFTSPAFASLKSEARMRQAAVTLEMASSLLVDIIWDGFMRGPVISW